MKKKPSELFEGKDSSLRKTFEATTPEKNSWRERFDEKCAGEEFQMDTPDDSDEDFGMYYDEEKIKTFISEVESQARRETFEIARRECYEKHHEKMQ